MVHTLCWDSICFAVGLDQLIDEELKFRGLAFPPER